MSRESTTLDLPSDLLAAVDRLVHEGQAGSRNELVEIALRRELAGLHRSALEAEFSHMAEDGEYQAEVSRILAEFSQSDREALREHPIET